MIFIYMWACKVGMLFSCMDMEGVNAISLYEAYKLGMLFYCMGIEGGNTISLYGHGRWEYSVSYIGRWD